MSKLSDNITRKFIESYDVTDWEIETDTGWTDVDQIHKTVEYREWVIKTHTGNELICADTHILFDQDFNEIFVKDCIPNVTYIQTRNGAELVSDVIETDRSSNMYDLAVADENHRFYTDQILSHNSTTTCAFLLWYIIFHTEKTVALLANKGDTAREIMGKVQLAYMHLPKWLQQGVVEWNKGSIVLENQSRVIATTTTGNSIRGYSINLLYIDECVLGETKVTVRNKKTGEVSIVTMEEIYEKYKLSNMEHLKIDELEVLTEDGFKSFTGIKKSKKSLYFNILFEDGNDLKCSYEHRIKVGDVFVEANKITKRDVINNKRISNIEIIEEDVDVYDLLNVEDIAHYITNGVTSHNCAFVENWDEFYTSTLPVVSAGNTTKIVLVSTPKGLNHFHTICENARPGAKNRNDYNLIEVPWQRVPGRNEAWKKKTLGELNFDMEKFSQEYECVHGDTIITVKDGHTGKIHDVTIKDFYNWMQFEE